MIQAGAWLSRTQLCRTQMWWTRSCRGLSNVLQQHGQQPLSCVSGLGEGTCPPLLTIFKSPAKALCQFWDPQYRKALTYTNKSGGGTQHQGCDQGLEHRMHKRREGKRGTFLQVCRDVRGALQRGAWWEERSQ